MTNNSNIPLPQVDYLCPPLDAEVTALLDAVFGFSGLSACSDFSQSTGMAGGPAAGGVPPRRAALGRIPVDCAP